MIFGVAILGSLSVPITVLTMARFGYFEPIEIHAFGRKWSFAPASKRRDNGEEVR